MLSAEDNVHTFKLIPFLFADILDDDIIYLRIEASIEEFLLGTLD